MNIIEEEETIPVKVGVGWVVLEREQGLWVPKVKRKNILTQFGLTGIASAPSGTYTPPVYLVIDSTHTALTATYSSGVTSIQTTADPTLVGDTQLVLGVGLASQETVTFTAKSGSGPYTFTLSPATVNSHTSGDPVVRAVTANDTLASVVTEAQYDPTFAPGLRAIQAANYSPAIGQNTMQFFISGIQATNLFFAHVGLADAPGVGAGSLHNYASFGYNHTNVNDIEIDITWTMTTS
jgi:hypothetical protein